MSELNVSPLTPTPETAEPTPTPRPFVSPPILQPLVKSAEEKNLSEEKTESSESESPEVGELRGPKIALPVCGQLSVRDAERIGVNEKLVRGLSPKESSLLPKLRAYSHEHTISLVLKGLCEQVPEAFPNYRTWEGPDPIPLIYERIQSRGHIEALWPSIRMVLGDNRFNINWTARVIIAMTVWMVVWDLAPTLKCNERYDK